MSIFILLCGSCVTPRGGDRGRAQYEHNVKEGTNVECGNGIKSVAYKVS